MLDELRPFLYYPLGLLPTIFFTLRILVQWMQSEKYQKSYVGRAFWRLSLAGNLLLMLHYIIQVQYPFALLQGGNAVISWRNLNLINAGKKLNTTQTVGVFLGTLAMVTAAFIAQSYFTIGELDWIRTPTKLFDQTRQHHHLIWHIIGTVGGTLFASRFWIQWWHAERHQRSELSKTFWWVSIFGSIVSLVYFVHIGDNISMIHYGFGLIPYARNLILMNRAQA